MKLKKILMEGNLDSLSDEIFDFLSKHAKVSPNFDPEYDDESEKFTSPDASFLYFAATTLKNGNKPQTYIDSSWSSGGYFPYNDQTAKKWHDTIINKLKNL